MTNPQRHYLETALWSSNDDGESLDKDFDILDIYPTDLTTMLEELNDFLAKAEPFIGENEDDAADDFWLTRNGHGSGFWDGSWEEPAATKLTELAKSFGECHLYIGDDGKLHYFKG